MSSAKTAPNKTAKASRQATIKKPQAKPRVRKLTTPKHKSFRLSKRIPNTRQRLPGAFRLLGRTFRLIGSNKKIFLGIIAVHVALSVIFVRGFGISDDFVQLKQEVEDIFAGSINQLGTSLVLFGYLATTAGVQTSEVAGAYRVFLSLIAALAVIWAGRQILAGEKIMIREAFYKGMYPLIPFILVLFVIGLQLLPAILGNIAYSVAISGGIAVTSAEKLMVLSVFLLLCLLSLYMVISSIFALYIATLPDMTPMKALRSARGLVIHRRWSVGLRLIVLPFTLILLALLVIIPLIIFVPILAEPVFFLASSFGLLFTNLYLYNLYRSLL